MELSLSVKQFIREHEKDDLNRLLLSASRYPDIDIPFVVEQIASRKQIKEKLPSWYTNEELIFPARITTEQCSSELTAGYKQRLVHANSHLCDLTGGLGVDSYYFSRQAEQVTYIERFPHYCQAARHNFSSLGAGNIQVLEGDAIRLLPEIQGIDVFYIDPARRGEGNKRIFALQDCEPDLTQWLPSLLEKAPMVIAKLSPMADISQVCSLLPGISAIHVLSVKNDCKELLFVIEKGATNEEPSIHCLNVNTEQKEEEFTFTFSEEKGGNPLFANEVQTYLYEPNTSLLKAGAFKSICRLGVNKLHISSHLYTSGYLIEDFPGRKFIIEEVLPYNNKLAKTLYKTIPQANITVRNFPVSVKELRKHTRIQEGGDVYLFATTLKNNSKVLINCRKV